MALTRRGSGHVRHLPAGGGHRNRRGDRCEHLGAVLEAWRQGQAGPHHGGGVVTRDGGAGHGLDREGEECDILMDSRHAFCFFSGVGSKPALVPHVTTHICVSCGGVVWYIFFLRCCRFLPFFSCNLFQCLFSSSFFVCRFCFYMFSLSSYNVLLPFFVVCVS